MEGEMKVLRIMLILVVIASLSLVACGGKKPKGPTKVWEPDWFGTQGSSEFVFAYGFAERQSQSAASTAAEQNAYGEASRYIGAHVQAMLKNFESEAGVDNPQVLAMTENVGRTVSNERFSGSIFLKRETIILDNGNHKAFRQLAIPRNAIDKSLMDKMRNEEALYNEFKASQAFQELDRLTR
jgi:hypothetical protein